MPFKTLRRAAALLLAALLLGLAGCSEGRPEGPPASAEPSGAGAELTRYQAQFLELFDTVTTVIGYAETEEEFSETVNAFRDELREYHELYDIYNDYEGVNNIKTINDSAGGEPVKVDRRIIDLLLFCREMYEATEGRTNVMMGSVLSLWHDARELGINDPERAELPDMGELEAAKGHTGFDALVIDEENSTVQITDPEASLDVGAVAKGYATQRACESLPAGLLVSVGGIIDPDTLMPPALWRAVTVLCPDSGKADALSTALFCLSREEGEALLEKFGAEALWIRPDGSTECTPGFEAQIEEYAN